MSKKLVIILYCPKCGRPDLEHSEDESYVKCTHCSREYLGGLAELEQLYKEGINKASSEVMSKFLDDFTQRLELRFQNEEHINLKRK